MRHGWLIVALTWMAGNACARPPVPAEGEGETIEIRLTSPAFAEGEHIPVEYTCDGPDRSPPLRWSDAPDGTQSLVLIVDDPDAPARTWVHWVLYNMPTEITELPEGLEKSQMVEGIGLQGTNDFRTAGYGGPCPPPGAPHRYFFKLYALDTTLPLPPGASKADVERAMSGHVLAEGQLVGLYGR